MIYWNNRTFFNIDLMKNIFFNIRNNERKTIHSFNGLTNRPFRSRIGCLITKSNCNWMQIKGWNVVRDDRVGDQTIVNSILFCNWSQESTELYYTRAEFRAKYDWQTNQKPTLFIARSLWKNEFRLILLRWEYNKDFGLGFKIFFDIQIHIQ